MKKLLPSILFTSIALVGCNPSDGSKGAVTLDIQAKASTASKQAIRTVARNTSASVDISVIDASGATLGTLTLDSAWVVVDEIELEHEDDYADNEDEVESEEVEFVGPFVVDLATNTTYPELPQVDIKAGNYTDIEFELEPLKEADVDSLVGLDDTTKAILTGKTIHFSGTYLKVNATEGVAFTFSTDEDIEFEFSGEGEASKGFMVDGAGLNDVIVAFRTDAWFDFSNTETNSNANIDLSVFDGNSVTIEAGSEIANVVLDNMEESAEYGEDLDDDGELDEDEDDDLDDEQE
ncbi:DUF4382 domain-containing protein [Reinekea forsetii]|nr:DUF4382 domain-containing protein [Reinekea forsetii]